MDIMHTFLNMSVLSQSSSLLLTGVIYTVLLGVTSIIISLILGLILVLLRLYSPKPIQFLTICYIDLFRAVPLLVFLVVVYYGLPFFNIKLSAFWAASAAISIVASAYMAETLRAGIEAVPRGQFEAANALGFSWPRMMTDIILPQAFKLVIPPLTGTAVSVIKDTALSSTVALPDVLKQAQQAQAYFANPTPLIGALFIYLILLIPLVRIVSIMEARQKRKR